MSNESNLNGDPQRVVIAPFWGEFGWMILQHLRFVQQYPAKEKIVCCERGHECLYPRATGFYFVENAIPESDRQNAGSKVHNPNAERAKKSVIEQVRQLYPEHQIIAKPDYGCHWHTSDLIKFKPTAKPVLPAVDVVLGVRKRGFDSRRNFEHWELIANLLRSHGISVGLAGVPDTSFDFASDAKAWEHPDGATAGTVDLLSRCKFFAGVDSGVAHLAALMDTPMVVLAPKANTSPDLTGIMTRANKRYCKVLPGTSWDQPELMLGAIIRGIRDANQPSQWFSQNGEDKWIAENLVLPAKGVFVEVGAATGVANSNTYCFEKCGWTGLAIEPDPRRIDSLKKQRRCAVEAVAIGSDQTAVFHMNAHADYSGFNRGGTAIPVTIKRLDEVLDAHGITEIDFLSIDTEGSELDVWSTFDPEKYKPRIVMIEWNTQGLPDRRAEIRAAVLAGPYKEVKDMGGNLVFERKA